MKPSPTTRASTLRHVAHRGGFTLVEMLVASGLVVLIMTMFAQIYSTAIGTMTEQRAMGSNDQKARILSDLIHRDLKNRTYRQADYGPGSPAGIVPLMPGDPLIDSASQRGYFYLSENDPLDPTDDVLQFTVQVSDEVPDDKYIGNTASLTGAGDDQPSRDGGSTAAEVCYFVRGGILYRRVLLLREPRYPYSASGDRAYDQPHRSDGERVFSADPPVLHPDYTTGTGRFLNDFDFSATRHFSGTDSWLWFNGTMSLGNVQPSGLEDIPIALPWNRFGHLNVPDSMHAQHGNHGCPREYAGNTFLGRLTHAETSGSNVTYPGQFEFTSFNRGNTTPPNDDGQRFGEDILLTNVESFDVEVWEPNERWDYITRPTKTTRSRFVNLGYEPSVDEEHHDDYLIFSEFNYSKNVNNPSYGPRTSGAGPNHVFDTWHTHVGEVGDGQLPPTRPVYQATNQLWQANTEYTIGDTIVLPSASYPLIPGPGTAHSDSIVYKVVGYVGTPTTPTSGPGSPDPEFIATLGNTITDNDIIWQCVDNRIGLRAIRITIRYFDQQSQLPRQLTIVHSFVH